MSKVEFKTTTSDEAVKKATGKIWSEWFKILDKGNAAKLSHTKIAKLLHTKFKVRPWWSQMVANTYEQYKGLRKKYENKDGFEASVSKTIEKPISQLFQWWKNFPEIKITSATPNKYIRGVMKDGTRMDVGFVARNSSKTQVVVQQHKLKNLAAVKQAKEYWKKILEKL